ncbi:MAG: hypothetical protein KatS3mg011_1683 [Acidimicrobiia bacterium]|nr:MAG: hypothetical protein KatS3mg011_1683 [Acidimicrobiia bacterium]
MTGIGPLDLAIAVLIGLAIWRGSLAVIRALSNPPDQPDPDAVVPTRQDYKCTVCGTEVTMTVRNVDETPPPRHCREEMIPVWRPPG